MRESFSGSTRAALQVAIVGATLAGGCNAAFGIHEGTLPPTCYDPGSPPLLIDDMEDGVGDICDLGGRHGYWFTVGDGTSNTLEPALGTLFTPTLIPGGRGNSHYAAELSGSGFTDWGALMGFNLSMNTQNLGRQPYDAGTVGGIKFWLKSDAPVAVEFLLPETIAVSDEGTCADSATAWNCNNHFRFVITAPSPDQWTEYEVPFSALAQSSKNDANGNVVAGSATWNPTQLVGVQFALPWGAPPDPATTYDVWVDDVGFYYCPNNTCIPTCADPQAPVACPMSGTRPAGCFREGTDCTNLLDGDLDRVWGSGSDDVWAIGASWGNATGILRHWNGTVWSSATSGTTKPLWGIWGSDQSDAWAAADDGTVVLWNGTSWSASTSESTTGSQVSLNAVWGSGPDDIYVVANPGTILHWNGASWSTATSVSGSSLWALWGSGPDDVWATGDGGTVQHWNGIVWSTEVTGANGPLVDVWGSATDDVWAVGGTNNQAALLHWDGTAWSPASTGAVGLNGVWGSGRHDVWAVGVTTVGGDAVILHWDGTAWSSVAHPAAGGLNGVWGSRSNDVWAVGAQGTTLHWDGFSWSVVPNRGTQ